MKKRGITGACQHTKMKGTGTPVAIMFMFGSQCIYLTRGWTSALESNSIYDLCAFPHILLIARTHKKKLKHVFCWRFLVKNVSTKAGSLIKGHKAQPLKVQGVQVLGCPSLDLKTHEKRRVFYISIISPIEIWVSFITTKKCRKRGFPWHHCHHWCLKPFHLGMLGPNDDGPGITTSTKKVTMFESIYTYVNIYVYLYIYICQKHIYIYLYYIDVCSYLYILYI